MQQAVVRTLEELGLEAVILHEKSNRGQTIIGKIERYSNVTLPWYCCLPTIPDTQMPFDLIPPSHERGR
jgi:hypothetical protein